MLRIVDRTGFQGIPQMKKGDQVMRVAIYGRVNSADLTADDQMKKLIIFCQNRAYEVVEEIADCCSGSAIGSNLKGLLHEHGQKIDAVVLRDLSRISRNTMKCLEVIRELKTKGIRFITVDYDRVIAMEAMVI